MVALLDHALASRFVSANDRDLVAVVPTAASALTLLL